MTAHARKAGARLYFPECLSRSFSRCRWEMCASRSRTRIFYSRLSGMASAHSPTSPMVNARDFAQRQCIQVILALNAALPAELRARSAVLDGEIVCLDPKGRRNFGICSFAVVSRDITLSTCFGAMAKICGFCRSLTASTDCAQFCRLMPSDCFTVTTSKSTAQNCSHWCAAVIWKESWRSGSMTRTCQNREAVGSKFGIGSIHNG